MHLILFTISFIVLLFEEKHFVSSSNVIYINSTQSRSFTCLIQSQRFYRKFQTVHTFVSKSTSIVIQIPGLIFPFRHQTPMIYRIHYQGICRITNTHLFLRILIDDHLIINEKFVLGMSNSNDIHGHILIALIQIYCSSVQKLCSVDYMQLMQQQKLMKYRG